MFVSFICLYVLASLFCTSAAQDGSKTCYSCASASLRSRWFLTGLAPVSDTMFTSSCDPNGGNMAVEDCSGPCLTMMFDDPDNIQQAGAEGGSLLVVRGCHPSLTKSVAERNMGGASFCEYDRTHAMSNIRGNMVTVRMLVEFCGSSNCNTRPASTAGFTTPKCDQQTQNNLLNNQLLNCYECHPQEGKNCRDSKCNKKYCMKQQSKVDGGFQLYKACSDVNLLGRDNMCVTYDVITNPGGIPVKNRLTQCFCKDKQYCNAGSFVSALSTGVLLIGAALVKTF